MENRTKKTTTTNKITCMVQLSMHAILKLLFVHNASSTFDSLLPIVAVAAAAAATAPTL